MLCVKAGYAISVSAVFFGAIFIGAISVYACLYV